MRTSEDRDILHQAQLNADNSYTPEHTQIAIALALIDIAHSLRAITPSTPEPNPF